MSYAKQGFSSLYNEQPAYMCVLWILRSRLLKSTWMFEGSKLRASVQYRRLSSPGAFSSIQSAKSMEDYLDMQIEIYSCRDIFALVQWSYEAYDGTSNRVCPWLHMKNCFLHSARTRCKVCVPEVCVKKRSFDTRNLYSNSRFKSASGTLTLSLELPTWNGMLWWSETGIDLPPNNEAR